MVPSIELTPPMPDSEAMQPQAMVSMKPDATNENSQTLDEKENKNKTKDEEQTVEPLGSIVITDPPPSTIDPAATVGKWPTEPPTELPITERDDENET